MSLFLIWNEGRGVSRSWVRGWLTWFAYPSGGTECSAHAQYTIFAANPLVFPPGSWEVAVELFGLLYLSVYNLPQLHMHIVIFSLYSCSVFCFWRRGLSRCKHCSTAAKDPTSQACPETRPDQPRKLMHSQTDAQQCSTVQTRINQWA